MPPGLFDFAGCGGGIEKVPRATSKAPEADTMDSLIAADLNQLSIQERESVFEEVHGIAKVQEKSPEEEAALVRELREELKNIRGKPELERAQFLCSSYADDPKFLLMFLRSENFVVKSAAVRMVTHFKHKLHLFGIEKLAKPITLEDLDDDDMDALLTGWVQPLSQKDRSGRPVLFLFNKALKYKSVENQIRAAWYITMSMLEEDEDARKKGVVFLGYNVDDSSFNLEFSMQFSPVSKGLPFRPASYHFCYNNVRLRPIIDAVRLLAAKSLRIRFRAHFGSDLEVLYALRGYGIAVDELPLVQNSGEIQSEFFKKHLEERKKLEEARKAEIGDTIMFPLKNDVLLGRGRPYQDFPGNVKMADIIDTYRGEYQAGKKLEKTALSAKVVKIVQDDLGGRFLRKKEDDASGIWVQVTDYAAREKVSHGFRTKPRKGNATKQDVSPDSGFMERSPRLNTRNDGCNKRHRIEPSHDFSSDAASSGWNWFGGATGSV